MSEISNTELAKYPIGPFNRKEHYTVDELSGLIAINEAAPSKYRQIIEGIKPEELLNTYRPGSWNVRQLVHHVADIQLLHFLRMKKAITEPEYTEVTLINMDGWASTPDSVAAPIEDSLQMFESINRRFIYLIRSLDSSSLNIAYYHPVRKYSINQSQAIAMAAWHVEHHLAHIKIALGKSY